MKKINYAEHIIPRHYNKLLILGIDCLDYILVHKWHLSQYMLKDAGYHFVGYDLYTPVIWAKFLTGEDVSKYGFSSKSLSRKKRLLSLYYVREILSRIIQILYKFKCICKQYSSQNMLIRNDMKNSFLKVINVWLYGDNPSLTIRDDIIIKLLIKATHVERLPKRLFKKTFIYQAQKEKKLRVLTVEFPTINDELYSIIRNILYFYVDSPIKERQLFLDYIWKITCKTLRYVYRVINHYDIILWYTPYIDIASHLFYRPNCLPCMVKLYSAYKKLAILIHDFIAKLPDRTIVLIISDHGYNPQKQDHSYFGYWSTNIQLPERPRSITDFAPLIKKIINRLIIR